MILGNRELLIINRTNLSPFTNTHPVTYSITTLTREKLAEYEQNAAQFTIPVGGLGSGVYFLVAVRGANRAAVMVTVVE